MMSEESTYSSAPSWKRDSPSQHNPLGAYRVALCNSHILTLPAKVDVWIVAVFSLSGVSTREGAEEGVGEQARHLLLRHGDGVVRPSLEEGHWLQQKQRDNRGRSKSFVLSIR